MTTPAIVWFRHDLRLTDHAALWAAVKRGGAVIPLFVWAPGEEGAWPPGAVSCWWLHQSLTRLAEDLRARGNALIIRNGPSRIALMEVARASGATAVYWSRRYEPAVVARDRALEDVLREAGLEVESFEGAVLHDPGEIRNKSGNPFQVFTPFWRACLARPEPDPPLPPAPERLSAVASVDSLPLGALARLVWRRRGAREVPVPGSNWRDSFRMGWRNTPSAGIFRARWERHDCRRISISGRSAPEKSGMRCGDGRQAGRHGRQAGVGRSSLPSWVGGSSLIICFFISSGRPRSRCGLNSRGSHGGGTGIGCALGNADGRVFLSWTQGCESYGERAGCTTVCGWWWHRSW
jgi:hypothetical protein